MMLCWRALALSLLHRRLRNGATWGLRFTVSTIFTTRDPCGLPRRGRLCLCGYGSGDWRTVVWRIVIDSLRASPCLPVVLAILVAPLGAMASSDGCPCLLTKLNHTRDLTIF